MKKTILIALLITISMGRELYAQQNAWRMNASDGHRTKTAKMFDLEGAQFNIRDFVHLKSAFITIELDHIDDYNSLSNFDSILLSFKRDIAFYKDSLDKNDAGNVRIDYILAQKETDIKKIRFKRYKSDGELFVKKTGETAKLKVEQDTIRIIMSIKSKEIDTYVKGVEIKKTKIKFTPEHFIQVTICLNNYTDVDKLIGEQEMMQHAIDTLLSTKRKGTVLRPAKFRSSSIYRPYNNAPLPALMRFNGILKNESFSSWEVNNGADKLTLNLNMGVGLVRNSLVPMADIGIALYNRIPASYNKGYQEDEYNTFVQLNVSPYFFFNHGSNGEYYVKDNWFVNLEMGGASQINGMATPLLTGGIGYLMVQKGDYFKGPTFKAFMTLKLRNSITLAPEFIFTNGFKQIFPGITLRLF